MKTKEKPKYNTLQNVGWMVSIAWKNSKQALLFCLLTAALEEAEAAGSLVQD